MVRVGMVQKDGRPAGWLCPPSVLAKPTTTANFTSEWLGNLIPKIPQKTKGKTVWDRGHLHTGAAEQGPERWLITGAVGASGRRSGVPTATRPHVWGPRCSPFAQSVIQIVTWTFRSPCCSALIIRAHWQYKIIKPRSKRHVDGNWLCDYQFPVESGSTAWPPVNAHKIESLRRTDPRRPRPWCTRVLRTITPTPHHTGWHARRGFGLCWRRTGSFVLRCRSQAAGDPTAG